MSIYFLFKLKHTIKKPTCIQDVCLDFTASCMDKRNQFLQFIVFQIATTDHSYKAR